MKNDIAPKLCLMGQGRLVKYEIYTRKWQETMSFLKNQLFLIFLPLGGTWHFWLQFADLSVGLFSAALKNLVITLYGRLKSKTGLIWSAFLVRSVRLSVLRAN